MPCQKWPSNLVISILPYTGILFLYYCTNRETLFLWLCLDRCCDDSTTISCVFLWLFPSFRVAGITDDLSSPHRPVRLLARSQSSSFQISLTRVFPSCFRSSSLPFPWYIRPQHFPQYVFAISPHHMPVPVQSSLGDLFGNLRHSCCSSDMFIPDLVFACHSAHPS